MVLIKLLASPSAKDAYRAKDSVKVPEEFGAGFTEDGT